MDKQTLKKHVINAIDAMAKEIIKIDDDLWRIPEVGYREYKTAEYARAFNPVISRNEYPEFMKKLVE